MKYSNFRNYCQKDTTLFAKVDVTTGWWPLNRTKTVSLFKSIYSAYWKDLDTGESLTDLPIYLDEAFKAKKLLTKIE
jgi:hypothetical protein